MKPRPFAYFAPRTLDEALALLAEHGSLARPLAGGQSLVQQMNLREVNLQVIIDLNRVPELALLGRASDGALVIGAMTRQQRLVDDVLVSAANPALTATASAVAFPAVRCRGTLGGSVAYAEPGAQLPLLLTVLDAQATIARRDSQRITSVSALFSGARATTLAPDELVIACTIPLFSLTAGYAIGEFRRGHAGPPLVSVVAIVEIDDAGAVSSAQLGVSGASEVPLRLRDEEALIIGRSASPEFFAEAAEMAAGRVEMGDQVLAGVGLRRRATRALLARVLAEATALAMQRRHREDQS
jgi:carbon-monoxide dehydrogenase medium subunit